jgi:hypothetical protein
MAAVVARRMFVALAVAALVGLGGAVWWSVTPARRGISLVRGQAPPAALKAHCDEAVGAPELAERYGQVDWSARAIYDERLGWFDERPERLYPHAPAERARRFVDAMGGGEAVRASAREAVAAGDPRWAVELYSLLRDAVPEDMSHGTPIAGALAAALDALASEVGNTNGRAYLLETGQRLRHGEPPLSAPTLDPAFLDVLPVSHFFTIMATRLDPELAADVHESARFEFTDTSERFTVTIRHGIAEVVAGEPLPGTPEPLAVVTTTTATWRPPTSAARWRPPPAASSRSRATRWPFAASPAASAAAFDMSPRTCRRSAGVQATPRRAAPAVGARGRPPRSEPRGGRDPAPTGALIGPREGWQRRRRERPGRTGRRSSRRKRGPRADRAHWGREGDSVSAS